MRDPLAVLISCNSNPQFFFQVTEVERWLMQTPPVTTIRVDLMRPSAVESIKDRVRALFNTHYGSDKNVSFVEHPFMPELVGISALSTGCTLPEEITKRREVIVDSNCGRSILRGAHVFAPGVLAMSKQCSEGDLVNVFVDLQGKCKKGSFDFAPEEENRKMFVGVGKVLQPRYKLYGDAITPSGTAVEMISTLYPHVPSIGDAYLSCGLGTLQNFPSMIAVAALSPQPGETILDMCSAPGHKTQHIAERMQGTGLVAALEKVKKKVFGMQEKFDKLQFTSVNCFPCDSSKCISDTGAPPSSLDGPPFLPASFDRVLLDAPCSGLGNRPQLPGSNKMTAKMLQSYPVLQKQLFFAAVAALKPGGTLVYSTCTVNQHENELMVAWALQKFPNLCLLPIDSEFGGCGWPTTGLTEDYLKMVRRFGPPTHPEQELSLHNSIGFFIAKFIKQE